VAAKIGKTDHFIALVVMAKNHRAPAQFAFGRGNALVHAAIRKYKIIIERTTRSPLNGWYKSSRHIFSAFSSFRNGDVESRSPTLVRLLQTRPGRKSYVPGSNFGATLYFDISGNVNAIFGKSK